jgi:hypothetical protein
MKSETNRKTLLDHASFILYNLRIPTRDVMRLPSSHVTEGKNKMRCLIMARIFILLCFVGNSYRASASASLPSPDNNRSVALIGAKIYPSPTATPIIDGVVLIQDGRVVDVGESAAITIPADAAKMDCAGLIMTSAFWNSHVHFTEPKWQSAHAQPAEQLAEHLRTMLT